MQDPQLALVPMPTSAIASVRPDLRQPLALYGLGIACLASIALFAAAMPVVSIGIMALAAISSFLVGSAVTGPDRSATRPADPESIVSLELRDTYRMTLFALDELDRTSAQAPRMRTSIAPALERCRAAVIACGRMAQLANPLQRYLEDHDPAHMRWELERLRARSDAARDVTVASALGRATAARRSQLATYDQIAGQRDRIHARLELVRAAVESFTAMIVKLHGIDQEQRVIGDDTVIAHLDEISDDLAVLESVLEADPAA